jgi:hypothetical protein
VSRTLSTSISIESEASSASLVIDADEVSRSISSSALSPTTKDSEIVSSTLSPGSGAWACLAWAAWRAERAFDPMTRRALDRCAGAGGRRVLGLAARASVAVTAAIFACCVEVAACTAVFAEEPRDSLMPARIICSRFCLRMRRSSRREILRVAGARASASTSIWISSAPVSTSTSISKSLALRALWGEIVPL